MSVRVCIGGRCFTLSFKEFEKALLNAAVSSSHIEVLDVVGGAYVTA